MSSVAVFGFGGLGFSALQLARAFGCDEVYVVDINPAKLASIATFGGIPIDATAEDPVEQILEATDGKGVDVSIELVGSAVTMGQAVRLPRRFRPCRARRSNRGITVRSSVH